MTEHVDFKLQHVVVAAFAYRHEAELAAGFLDDAEIPYRLQIDDPAMGMSIATPARIWVRAVDFRRAREVLELPTDDRAVTEARAANGLEKDGAGPEDEREAPRDDAVLGKGGPAHLRVVRHGPGTRTAPGDLGGVERILSLVLAVGAAAGAILFPPSVVTPPVVAVLWAVAILFGLGALLGRTIPALARLLRSLSGTVQ